MLVILGSHLLPYDSGNCKVYTIRDYEIFVLGSAKNFSFFSRFFFRFFSGFFRTSNIREKEKVGGSKVKFYSVFGIYGRRRIDLRKKILILNFFRRVTTLTSCN